MTKEQEKIAEKIISLHKEKDGKVTADQLHHFIEFKESMDSILIMRALEELNIIEYFGNSKYWSRLTEYGWKFPGFELFHKIEKEMSEKDKLITDLTIKQLRGNIFQLKYWWLLILISGIIGFITGNFKLILEWLK